MSNTDRLINHNDASQIASLLEDIGEQYSQVLTIPTLINDGHIEYDGETHSVAEVLDGYDPERMILTGDVEVSEDGKYVTSIQLRFVGDTWSDRTTEAKTVNWSYGDPYLGITWANGTDEQIAEMVAAADRGEIDLSDYWNVGDERTVYLSAMSATGVGESHAAQDVTFVILHKGLYKDSNDKTVNFIVGLKNGLYNRGYMNSSNTNSGSWDGCARRTWCNSVFYNSLPSTFKSLFKQFKTVTAQTYNGSTNKTSLDYFALPAAKEVFGGTASAAGADTSYSNLTEFNALTQFDYYKTAANRIKQSNGANYYWWERSPRHNNSVSFCNVNPDGTMYNSGASEAVGLAPFGCI